MLSRTKSDVTCHSLSTARLDGRLVKRARMDNMDVTEGEIAEKLCAATVLPRLIAIIAYVLYILILMTYL